MMDFKAQDFIEPDFMSIGGYLILPIVAICVYVIGILLHAKIIKMSINVKEMTWKLDVTNSFLLMTHYAHILFMNLLTFFVHDVHNYTGKWFCYASKLLFYYGGFYMAAHTLVVAIMKYVMIVHWEMAMVVGHDRIKEIFFWIHFLHPTLMICLHFVIRPDFLFAYDAYRESDICLGDPKHNLDPARNESLTKLHNLCEFPPPPSDNSLEFLMYALRTSVCSIQFILFYFVLWNFLEIFFYILIFKFMRK